MSNAAIAGLINAEMVLRFKESSIQKHILKLKKQVVKENQLLTQLMQDGDQEMIDDQARSVVDIEGHVRSLTKTKLRLHMFERKIQNARLNHEIGASMLAVSKALGRVTQTIQLDKIEAIMTELGKQYDDIDVMTDVMAVSTANTTATTASPEAVEILKRRVADAAGLELSQNLKSDVPAATIKAGPTAEQEAESAERLKALRQLA